MYLKMIKFTDKIYNWKLKSFLKFPGRLDNCCRHRRNVLVVSSTTTNNDNDSNNDDKDTINDDNNDDKDDSNNDDNDDSDNNDKDNINNDNNDKDMDDKHNSDKQPAYAPVPEVNIQRVITWTKFTSTKCHVNFVRRPRNIIFFKSLK